MTAVAAWGYTALPSAVVADPDTHTPHRNVRVGDDRWRSFGFVTGKLGRSRWLTEFIDWVIADPDLWRDVRIIATVRGDDLGATVRASLRRYRARHTHLLVEPSREPAD